MELFDYLILLFVVGSTLTVFGYLLVRAIKIYRQTPKKSALFLNMLLAVGASALALFWCGILVSGFKA